MTTDAAVAAALARAINASPKLVRAMGLSATAEGDVVTIRKIRRPAQTGRVPGGLIKSIFRRARDLERIR